MWASGVDEEVKGIKAPVRRATHGSEDRPATRKLRRAARKTLAEEAFQPAVDFGMVSIT
jgi:hypothetical protein